MRLFTSYWQSAELRKVDAVIVSISRGQPRWKLPFSYRRMRELAPSDEAWSREDPQEFTEVYRQQLESLGVERIVADLERIAGNRPAVLLCWEKPGEFCHRHVLSAWLQERGVEIRELQPGDLPRRPDAPQPSLFP